MGRGLSLDLTVNTDFAESQVDEQQVADARYERLDEPFEIRPGVFIPAEEHRFSDLGLWFETNPSRAVSANGWVQKGGFYDGDRLATA